MSIFAIDRCTEEINIRRKAGAKSFEMTLLLNKEFIKLALAAFMIV